MTDVLYLNDRLNHLCDRQEAMQREYDRLQTVAMTTADDRMLRRLDLRIQGLTIDIEQARERLTAACEEVRSGAS
jgi:hypothetical protein